MKQETIVVALGGNAILQAGQEGTYRQQLKNVETAVAEIARHIEMGYRVTITHGNGPQVGNLYIQNSLAGEAVPPMPLDVCSAESQGLIGYFIQQELQNRLNAKRISLPVATVVTQVLVAADDPAFQNPTKPIGPFHNEKEARLLMERTSFVMKEDKHHRWRRVVPSPKPVGIVEKEVIGNLVNDNCVVVASGGGGIPVVADEKGIIGVEAVIDKDLSACRLALDIQADVLLILTDVEKVALNYNTPEQKWIDSMNAKDAREYLTGGHFSEGSMKPKVEAGITFLEQGGRKSIIGALFSAHSAVEGDSGTTITP